MSAIDRGREFAIALDEEDYERARFLLAADCIYHVRGEAHVGPEAILASYRGNGDSARSKFDSIEYSSNVTSSSPKSAEIEFRDVIHHNGQEHVFACRQDLTIGADGLIHEIRHIDPPGAREGLAAFLVRVGLDA